MKGLELEVSALSCEPTATQFVGLAHDTPIRFPQSPVGTVELGGEVFDHCWPLKV